MLMAHSVVPGNPVRQYEALRAPRAGNARARQRTDDPTSPLCVPAGAGDADAAPVAARHRLPGARSEDDPVLGV
ncbi:DUF5133 domain-containing protein [Streptomyces sp. TRM 70351]|uniref:DUF5133 domain-containing protein n=1 Tax=Streptomyces sp. TRM 70351 TaxID=3116552 RepID=UPI002E7C1353|nr:DUF5133 domain-containing protein [Streptomyces sp. TRM 70351]MEE1927134.1 DUF5133 domain-containing protein [Streptomyces sp. TRM 70351]